MAVKNKTAGQSEPYVQDVQKGCTVYSEFKTKADGAGKNMDTLFPEEPCINYGILNEKGDAEVGETYQLHAGDSLQKFISMDNQMGADCNFTLLAFRNYKQVPLWVEGEKMMTCSVHLDNGKNIQVPVELKDFESGRNDVVFVWFIDTNREMTKEGLASANDNGNAVALRCQVCVDGEEFAATSEESDTVTYFEEANNDIMIQNEYQTDNRSLDKIVLPQDESQVYIAAGNYNDSPRKCAVILLQDFQQVKINDEDYVYLEIPSQMHTSIPVSADVEKGKQHSLTAILIDGANEVPDEGMNDVMFSDRIIIEREEK